MLTSLSIRDIVLIERLDLAFEPGLCALTGETGAGKSILLDSLGLALGARAERGLIRAGAEQGVVTAAFTLPAGSPAARLAAEHGLELEDGLILRRVLTADGRSRAFVNDQPVGTGLLRQLGEGLVEVHGQHAQQGLQDAPIQRQLLDAYGRHEPLLAELAAAHAGWRSAEASLAALREEVAKAAQDADYWRHALAELSALAPEVGEEQRLAERRTRLMAKEKLLDALNGALDALRGEGGLASRLGRAQRPIERLLSGAEDLLLGPAQALERIQLELGEAEDALERAGQALTADGDRLETVEERLFALRAMARKHQLQSDQLPELLASTAARLERIEAGDQHLTAAAAAAASAKARFAELAGRLSQARGKAAEALAKAVMAELPPLKLERARFVVRLLPLAEADWSAAGAERVAFEVATNPGQTPQPLAKVASGGELARLMLALKVVLARVGGTPCLVFDEVDSGIGGATADAVGERLARLGKDVQVLVVTHAPQVAAAADQHWRVEKQVVGRGTRVTVTPLGSGQRREEIARMLAGATVTDAARAAADSLMSRSA